MSSRQGVTYSVIATGFVNAFSGESLCGLEIFERKMFWYIAF